MIEDLTGFWKSGSFQILRSCTPAQGLRREDPVRSGLCARSKTESADMAIGWGDKMAVPEVVS